MNCNQEASIQDSPFLLSPKGKCHLWGGTRLKSEYSKEIDLSPLAETWECSTHPDGQSTIASGKYKGCLLSDVIKAHPEYLGVHSSDDLPILIKLIDAEKDLSVQVHPDDLYAKEREGADRGKREFWYILDAKEKSTITYGFANELTRENVREYVNNRTIEKYLQKIPVKRDEVYYIPAGCVHAIGAGVLIAEIQDNSNLTYRLYDYNRRDESGDLRELQVEKALDVACLKKTIIPRQPIKELRFKRGYVTEILFNSECFSIERIQMNTEQFQEPAIFNICNKSFQVLLCIGGCGSLYWCGERIIDFKRGDCIFIPANSAQIKLHGIAQLLKVKC